MGEVKRERVNERDEEMRRERDVNRMMLWWEEGREVGREVGGIIT
jgi:hypothetical protein